MSRNFILALLAALLSFGGICAADQSYDAKVRAEKRQTRADRSRGTGIRVRQPRLPKPEKKAPAPKRIKLSKPPKLTKEQVQHMKDLLRNRK